MNSAAIEKPSDRTLGGIVSESAAKMPGHEQRRRARRPAKFIAIAMPRFGANANAVHARGDDDADDREHAQAEPGSRSMSRDASGMPRRMRDDLPGSANAATTPRWKSSEVEDVLVEERRERDEPDERRPRGTAASTRCGAACRPARGCGSTPRTTAGSRRSRSPAASRRRPPAPSGRGPGSCSRRPRRTNTIVGIDEHEERHPPAEELAEQAAERRGPMKAPNGEPDRVEAEHVGAHFGWVVVGEQRVVRRRDHRAADARARARDHEHQHGDRRGR